MCSECKYQTEPTSNYELIMDPRTARYIMDYLYFSRDVEPVWYYKKVSDGLYEN